MGNIETLGQVHMTNLRSRLGRHSVLHGILSRTIPLLLFEQKLLPPQ